MEQARCGGWQLAETAGKKCKNLQRKTLFKEPKNCLEFKEPVDGHEILVEEGQSAGERRAPKRK